MRRGFTPKNPPSGPKSTRWRLAICSQTVAMELAPVRCPSLGEHLFTVWAIDVWNNQGEPDSGTFTAKS